MRHYELMVILDPDLEERTVAPSLDKFLNVVRKGGGTVEKVDVWGRRRLAYDINKKAEGIYAVVDMTAEPAVAQELDRQLGLNESVLRTKLLRPEGRGQQPPVLSAARPVRPGRPEGQAHGRRHDHHDRRQHHQRPRAALHAVRRRGRELHDRLDAAPVRPPVERVEGRRDAVHALLGLA